MPPVLDVACGTGEHLRHLQDLFAHVEGVEIAESMRSVAAHKPAPRPPSTPRRGGVVVEPWFTPEQYHDGAVGHLVAE